MLNQSERDQIAGALALYAEGVQENIADDDLRDHEEEMDGEPSERGYYPVVEDYLADADRIRMGEQPLHELTREVLLDEQTGTSVLTDDPGSHFQLVKRLFQEAGR